MTGYQRKLLHSILLDQQVGQPLCTLIDFLDHNDCRTTATTTDSRSSRSSSSGSSRNSSQLGEPTKSKSLSVNEFGSVHTEFPLSCSLSLSLCCLSLYYSCPSTYCYIRTCQGKKNPRTLSSQTFKYLRPFIHTCFTVVAPSSSAFVTVIHSSIPASHNPVILFSSDCKSRQQYMHRETMTLCYPGLDS